MNKADKARLDSIHNLPCVCCLSMKVNQPAPTEAHHLVDKGNRKASGDHQATAAICSWHHRAEVPMGEYFGASKEWLLLHFGPSMKYQGSKGEFERCFGTQRELLEKTNELLDTISGNN